MACYLLEDACSRYCLNSDEFLSWQRCIDRFGLAGLRSTRTQFYLSRVAKQEGRRNSVWKRLVDYALVSIPVAALGGALLNDGSCLRGYDHSIGNHVWNYDFVEAQTHDGRKVRLMTLIDQFTRE